jgi:hypothetical protein
LREAGSPVNLIIARGIIVSTIIQMQPCIFEKMFKDGSHFWVSDSFVQRFLHGLMSWSLRLATQAAKKRPKDWEDQCERSFFRKAYAIEEYNIHELLYVNFDQTQVVYAPGNLLTYNPTGSKQVAFVGIEEKWALTLMVSVAGDGTILPFQEIYRVSTRNSIPSAASLHYEDAMAAGFLLEFSGTKPYWSSHKTMHTFMNNILAPYFARRKTEFGLPPEQKALWQIDM